MATNASEGTSIMLHDLEAHLRQLNQKNMKASSGGGKLQNQPPLQQPDPSYSREHQNMGLKSHCSPIVPLTSNSQPNTAPSPPWDQQSAPRTPAPSSPNPTPCVDPHSPPKNQPPVLPLPLEAGTPSPPSTVVMPLSCDHSVPGSISPGGNLDISKQSQIWGEGVDERDEGQEQLHSSSISRTLVGSREVKTRGGSSEDEPSTTRPHTQASMPKASHKESNGNIRGKSQNDDLPDFASFRLEDQVADILATFNPVPTNQNSSNLDCMSAARNPYTDPLSNMDVGLSSLLTYPGTNPTGPLPSLSATIYGLAVSNPSFFLALRKAVPPEYCAISFFKRLENQIRSIGRKYSEYLYATSMGSQADVVTCSYSGTYDRMMRGFGAGRGFSIADDEEPSVADERWCERSLVRRIENVKRHLVIRKPLGKEARKQAFRALLRALWEVVERGCEEKEMYGFTTYTNSPGGSSSRVGASAGADQNPYCSPRNASQLPKRIGLYDRLIGAPGAASSSLRKHTSAGSFLPSVIGPGGGMLSTNSGVAKYLPSLPPTQGTSGASRGVQFFAIGVMRELTDVAGPFLESLERLSHRIRSYGAHKGFLEEFDWLVAEISSGCARQEGKATGKEVVKQALRDSSRLGFVGHRRRSSSADSTKRARSASMEEESEKLKRRC